MKTYLEDNGHWTPGSQLGHTGRFPKTFCMTNEKDQCFIFWEVAVEDTKEVTFTACNGLEKVGLSKEAGEAMYKQAAQAAKDEQSHNMKF